MSSTVSAVITVLALLFIVANVIGYHELTLALSDPLCPFSDLISLAHALTWVGALMLWGCKVPILILYITLFGIKTWLKVTSYAIIIATGIIFLVLSSFVTARCSITTIDIQLLHRCSDATTMAGVGLGFVSLFTDVLIFILPISVIARLHLSFSRRFGIAMVFASGLAGIAASAISTWYKWQAREFSAQTGINTMICTIAECAVAVMVACAPGIYGFFSQNAFTSGLYSRFSSAFSQIFLNRSRRSARDEKESARSNSSHHSTRSTKMNNIRHTEHEVAKSYRPGSLR